MHESPEPLSPEYEATMDDDRDWLRTTRTDAKGYRIGETPIMTAITKLSQDAGDMPGRTIPPARSEGEPAS